MLRRLVRGRKAQAAVETAIMMPLMVFMLLGLVQLTLIQQARLMTENAAFHAARAGIVFSANRAQMTNAAFLAVVPALPIIQQGNPMQSMLNLGQYMILQEIGRIIDSGIESLEGLISQLGIQFSTGIPPIALVRAEPMNPTQARYNSFVQSHPEYQGRNEIDFDDTSTALTETGDPGSSNLKDINRLTVQVRFLYPMRIPFANWVIHLAWMAQEAGVMLTGAIERPENRGEVARVQGVTDPIDWIFGSRDRNLLRVCWQLSQMSPNPTYVIPLRASYTMRMQSNIFFDNLRQ